MIKACDSPIGQPEKKPKYYFKRNMRGRGGRIFYILSKCIRKFMFYLWNLLHFFEIFYSLFVWFFFLIFLKVTRENNITLIWRFVHVHLFVFKWLKFNFYVGISEYIYIFFLILDVTISWEKMQINIKILEKC